jgi:simple sugar transport system ATP-binding protein
MTNYSREHSIEPSIAAPVVEAERVSKSYGAVQVLKNVSISIPQGDSRALVGRNGAGKSTLVGLLTGITAPTSGEIRFGGQSAPNVSNRPAWRANVACVYQRWTVIPTMTVAENLFLNNQPTQPSGIVNWRRMRERAAAVLRDWSLDLHPDLEAWRLTVEQRQIVEIARALLQGSRFIILDEPTAELERKEVNRLFDRIKRLQEDGVTFCYISHHLEEIYEICRTATVLRDGQVVADTDLAHLPKNELVAAMVGSAQNTARRRPPPLPTAAKILLSVDRLSIGHNVKDVSFEIAAGECLGLAGLATSGKEEIGAALAGLIRPTTGRATLAGSCLAFGDVARARRAGVGYVPRDRHEQGLLPQLSLGENITITILDRLGKLGLVSPKRQRERAASAIEKLAIVASSQAQPISELSGGNQQKGIMARALASSPKLLVLVSPTQGVDIASKDALFAIVAEAQRNGTAVLLISDDLDELAACNRVHVVFRGELTREFGNDWREQDMVAAIEGLEEAHERH